MGLNTERRKGTVLKSLENKDQVRKTNKLKLISTTTEEIEKRRVKSYKYAL